jgi:hypothetical protein
MGDNVLLEHFIAFAVVVYPVWRIYARAGLNPALSLFLAIPFLGWFLVLGILTYAKWPATATPQQER